MGWVLFFDGDCAFCSAAVRRAAKLDTRKNVRFAPLQGKLAGEKGFASHAAAEGGTMVVMRESDGKVFTRSDAWIELMRALGGGWKLLVAVKFIPKIIRDTVYQWVADHRYLISRKGNFCEMPDPEVQKRILE